MDKNDQFDSRNKDFQAFIDFFLKNKAGNETFDPHSYHLDEDVLSAFVDGQLFENEAVPVVSHLANCGYCRDISAKLIKLNAAFAEEHIATEARTEDSSEEISSVLTRVLENIFGNSKGAVFAHRQDDEYQIEEEISEDGSRTETDD